MKRRIVIGVIVVVLGVAGFFGYQYYRQRQSSATSTYQTETIGRGSLTALIGGTGTVRANQSTQVGWQTTGRIGEIKVKLDDPVEKGAELAVLDEFTLSQSIILARADLINAKKTLTDLTNSEVARAQAQLVLAQAQKALDDARDNRTNKNYQRASQSTLDQARANYILADQRVKDTEDVYSLVASRPVDDVARAGALSALSSARLARDRALANLNYLLGHPDDQEIAEADARVVVAEANLKDAQRNWDRLKDGPNPDDTTAAKARVTAIQSTLDMVNIEAPFAGTITQANAKVGDQVNPGTISFRLDDLSRLLVDVQIPEVDINRVQVGQPVKLTFDAISGKEYNGKVSEVAQVGVSTASGVNFNVTIQLTDADSLVRPGMTAAVNIVIKQLDNVVVVPNRAVRLRDGKRVVYVLQANNPVPQIVQITIGSSSELVSEIAGGELKEGDLVVLNPPAEPQTGRPPMGGGPGGN